METKNNPSTTGKWEKRDDESEVKRTAVAELPGWYWENFSDGSGRLMPPAEEGQESCGYFAYERPPLSWAGEVEYQDDLFRISAGKGVCYRIFGRDEYQGQSSADIFLQFQAAMVQNVVENLDLFKADIERYRTFAVVDTEGRSITAYKNIRGNEIVPGDWYVAKRNTGWHLAKCMYVNQEASWVMPDPPGSIYSYDCHECYKVKLSHECFKVKRIN